jgi:teichuronic acid biosynthesis glycosyltransferase TuaH
MKGKDYIFTGLQTWDVPIGSNAIDIAKEISKDNRVLYVNTPLDQMTLLKNQPTQEDQNRFDILKKKKEPLRKMNENLWVLDFPFSVWSINMLSDGFLFDFFNKWNNKKMFKYVANIANILNFKDVIHFIDNDVYRSYYSKDILKPKLSIYYRRDNLLPVAYWKKHALRLEPKLIEKSDLVVCNSPQLADFSRIYNKVCYDIGQGLDLSAYDAKLKFEIPREIEPIPTPRIGYIGEINSLRLDADLLYALAQSKPDYSFIMIGREDALFASHALHTLKNVHFLGAIDKNKIPQYMSTFQVCLNPQLLNEITNGNYPRKVDEYLALGKPVIATKTATMALFKDYTYLCSSLDDYQNAIEKALADDNTETARQRMIFAQSHSWENNVKRLYDQIRKVLA